ncbi:MAG TPA: enoyl-CoA hydratase/isomerase family protein [Bacillales bacterium]|nr:enoyl-CoA hydratase/isomerase family protein [Bacillales bacterium]
MVKDCVGYIKLNRPEKLNSLSRELVKEAIASLDAHSQNPKVKVIILSGAGKGFCAGGDIQSMQMLTGATEATGWVEFVSGLTKKIMELDKYVIAAVHGYAAGAGFSIALAADFIVASQHAKFALSFTNIGLIPDLGLIKTLSERLSPVLAKEWISSGKIVQAEDALSYGIINRVVEGDVVKGAEEFAGFIFNGPPIANKYVKYLVNNVPSLNSDTAFMQENMIQTVLLQSADHKEGVTAFVEKRKPNFKGC